MFSKADLFSFMYFNFEKDMTLTPGFSLPALLDYQAVTGHKSKMVGKQALATSSDRKLPKQLEKNKESRLRNERPHDRYCTLKSDSALMSP